MTIPYWLDQTSQPKPEPTCDFLIVGAGIAGLSTAYWLQQAHPDARIVILERQTLGAGASARNAGFITCGSIEHYARLCEQHGEVLATQIWRFSEENRELLKEHIIQDQSKEVQFRQCGITTLAHDQAQWERLQSTAERMARANLDIAAISTTDIMNKYCLEGYVGGVVYNRDGQIHPGLLLRHLRSKLRAQILENQEVFRIHEDGGIETPTQRWRPQYTFFTLNAYLPLIAPEFSKLITPNRGQILVTQPVRQRIFGPTYITHHLAYMRQLEGGELLIGGFRKSAPQNEETYLDATTDWIQEALTDYIEKHFGKVEAAYRWSGIMGFSPDGQMLIGRHPTRKNISLMAGCSGHGMGLSFHCAKVLAESYDGKPVPAHLDAGRFLK